MEREELMTRKVFIGGKWVDSESADTYEVFNPATGEVIAEVPKGSEIDVERAVGAAHSAIRGRWGDSTPRERSEALLRLADLVERNATQFADLESANVGKPITMLLTEEMPATIDELRFFAAGARCLEGKPACEYVPGHTSMIRREPIGVIGSIAPWNYPLQMAVWKALPGFQWVGRG